MAKNITQTQARRWQLTKNDGLEKDENCRKFRDDLEKKFRESERARYLIWCFEKAPTTGHTHCHMYFEMKTPVTGGAMQAMFAPGAHLEMCKGSQKTNIDYIKKHGQFWELGEKCGKSAYANLVDAAAAGKDIKELTEQFPEEVIRNRTNVVATVDMYGRARTLEKVSEKVKKIEPRPWQAKILTETEKEPDDRKVIWIADPAGGSGKSTLIKMLICKYGLDHVLWITGGSMKDIAHAWKGEEIICFNYCRSLEEAVNYNAIESVKDGMVFSPKYDSCKKLFPSPHVIVTANFAPDTKKLTQDRWDIRWLNGTEPASSAAKDVNVTAVQAMPTIPQIAPPPVQISVCSTQENKKSATSA